MRQKMSPYGCEIRSVSATTNQTTRPMPESAERGETAATQAASHPLTD